MIIIHKCFTEILAVSRTLSFAAIVIFILYNLFTVELFADCEPMQAAIKLSQAAAVEVGFVTLPQLL